MGIKVVGLSLIDVRSACKTVGPKVGAIPGGPDWWYVDKFYTGELSGRVESTEVDIIGLQDSGSNVGDCSVIIIMKYGTSVWRAGV